MGATLLRIARVLVAAFVVLVLGVLAWWARDYVATTATAVGGSLNARWSDFASLKPETQISALQLAGLVLAGLWVFFLYQRRREGQATVRVAMAWRVVGGQRLFVRLQMSNESAVVVHDIRLSVTLLKVTPADNVNGADFAHVATRDALLIVNGEIKEEHGIIRLEPSERNQLEPGEGVETEVIFELPVEDQGLIGLRCEAQGEQGTFPVPHWWGWPWRQDPSGPAWGLRFRDLFVWSSFAIVDPSALSVPYEDAGIGPARLGRPNEG
jgi:hypothetical protein